MHAGQMEDVVGWAAGRESAVTDLHPLYYLWEHKLTALAALVTCVTAAVATAPVPTSPTLIWLYDWAHQVFNIKNTRLVKEAIPTPPETEIK